MLKTGPQLVGMAQAAEPDIDPPTLFLSSDLSRIWRATRRQWPLILGTGAVIIALALVYCLTAEPQFTATASILIDTRKNQLLSSQQVVSDPQLDSAGVDSQAEVLKSESVALSVISNLKLLDDPTFTQGGGAVSALLASVGWGDAEAPQSDFEKQRKVVGRFSDALKVRRIGVSYVLQISFTSPSAGKSAEIANAIADAYMVNELEARYQATKRASRWLQSRIAELRTDATSAENRVQDYRTENGIISTGRGLLNEQQLADVNTQLVASRAATAEAKARLDRIDEVSRGDIPDASVTDALRSEVITRLRAQYLDLAARQSDWSSRFGPNHAAVINVRNQMSEIRRSIADELRRIGETYKSEFEIARAREQSLQESLARLIGEAGKTAQAQVGLRDLESSAQTSRNLYDNFLQRFMEATQQQTFPMSEARLITAATPPIRKSEPRTLLVLFAASITGAFFGGAAAFLREQMDNVFRTPTQLEAAVSSECLGVLPKVLARSAPPVLAVDASGFSQELGIGRVVVDAPFSRFSETIRNVKVAVDLSGLTREVKVLGIVSSLPNEGKTTVASNFALLAAHAGNRVLIIDGDLRNPSLTRVAAPGAETGLLEVLTGHTALGDAVLRDPGTGLHLLPAVVRGRISQTSELLSSKQMASLLEGARESYDLIVVDLPPVLPVVDVRAVAHLIDAFVCVVEWGRTTREVVREAQHSAEIMHERTLGFILNKANPRVLKRLEGYKGRYYDSYYSS